MKLNQSARMVTVMDTLAIKAMPAQTVNDILKYAIGVDVRQRGVEGVQTDISIRGGTFDQIAVLLNGINVCDPQTGHFAVDLPLQVSEVERIEVLEGPAGRVYGTSSLVGAINIVTKDAEATSADAFVEGGSYGYFAAGARGNVRKGASNHSLSAGYSRSDGYSRSSSGNLNSDYETVKAFYSGSWGGHGATVRWQAGISDKGFGANTFYSASYDEQYEHTTKTHVAVQAETDGFIHFRPAVYWNHGRDRFELFRGSEDAVKFNYHRTDVYGLNLNSWFETALGKTSFGAEMRNEGVVSTTLGDSLNSPKPIHGTDRSYTLGLNRTNISLFLEHNVVLRSFTASGGLTAVRNTGNERGFKIYPGLDASLRLSGNFKAYASLNTSLRQPTFTELYYSVGGHKADKYLKPEEMTAYEVGLKYLTAGLRLHGAVYYHHGSNMIDWIKTVSGGEESPWTSVNHTKLNTFGQEFSAQLLLPDMMGRDFPLESLYIGYSHISQDKDLSEGEQSRYALEYLRHKVVAKADLRLWKKLTVNIAWRWQDREGSYAVYEGRTATGEIRGYRPFSVTDVKLAWSLGRYELYAIADNIFDYTYYDHGNIPQPGFIGRLGLSVSL